jgi:hypothetical protein
MKKVVIIDGLNMFLRIYIINPTMAPKGTSYRRLHRLLEEPSKGLRTLHQTRL